mmetsp:Transcript_20327/g.66294  ORF Transcript_20327/g.66294 Transcript_20327/m.66294 type:complete len:590 (+) Transcript_20327:73-1842(+)
MRLIALLAFLPLCACGGSPAAEGADRGEHLKEWARITEEAAAADGPPLSSLPLAEEWYQVTIADVPVGYMNTLTSVDDDGSARSMEVMDVQVNRGADTSRMAFETVFQEAPLQPPSLEVLEEAQRSTGGVTLMAYDQRFANNEVKMGLTFPDGEMKLVSFNGEKEHVSMLPRPEQAWLGRLRARLEFTRQCRAGATEIVVQTMRPELGPRVVNLTSTLMRIDKAWDGTQMVEASVWAVQISDVPVNMTEAYETRGATRCYRMLQMGLDMPFGYLLASLSEKEPALQSAEPDANRPLPELVYTMFVILAQPIERVNEARMVEISVGIKAGSSRAPVDLKLPTGGYQRVEPDPDDAARLRVWVDLMAPQDATPEELAETDFRSPSAMIDSSDEVIIELSHKADPLCAEDGKPLPKGHTNGKLPIALAEELAYALRQIVHEHIEDKHLSTAYASASETARTASGDCTEHAVLLAAVLRARGIPSRVCHGLVYVEQGGSAIDGQVHVDASGNVDPAGGRLTGQYGWHMWTQALIAGKWIDLDATLHLPFTVGHVLVGTSSMADKDAHNNHMQMAALIGNLEITVHDVSHSFER